MPTSSFQTIPRNAQSNATEHPLSLQTDPKQRIVIALKTRKPVIFQNGGRHCSRSTDKTSEDLISALTRVKNFITHQGGTICHTNQSKPHVTVELHESKVQELKQTPELMSLIYSINRIESTH